jgi:hypothetical protein
MALVVASTLALYALALMGLQHIPGVDILMPFPIFWVGAFSVAVVFAAWNVWDDTLDARATYQKGAPSRTIAGALWRLRSDALQGACCTAMAGAGALAIVQWGNIEIRTACITAAAVALVANQIWNRLDRERVVRMPSASEEARYHAAQSKIRRLEAQAALAAADKHEALQVAARDRLAVGVLTRILRRHGIELPPMYRERDEAP